MPCQTSSILLLLTITVVSFLPLTLSIPQAIPPAAYRYIYGPPPTPKVSPIPSPQVSVLPLQSSDAALPANSPFPSAVAASSSSPDIHCTAWTNWTASYKEKDCFRALDIFYEHDVIHHMRQLYEFVSKGDRPVGRDPPVWVPRGAVFKSCTIAFGMMGGMQGLPLPSEPEGAVYVRTDTSSYWDVYALARRIIGGCVSTFEEVGWGTVGEDKSVGVFVWGSGSPMQKANFGKIVTDGAVLISAPNGTAVRP